MMTRRWHAMAAGLALLLTAACNRTPEADPARAEDYRLTLPVTPAPGAPVQRLVLPAAALSAIQRADMGDIRVLDGANRPLSIALLPGGAAAETEQLHELSAYPVLGSPGRLNGGMAIRVENASAYVVMTDSREASPGDQPVALLIDTRPLTEPVTGIVLSGDLPEQQPVTVTLDASADLKSWEPVGEKVLFRPGPGAEPLGGGRIDLPGIDLKDRYLRASWNGVSGVNLTAGRAFTAPAAQPSRLVVPAGGLVLQGTHDVMAAVPFAAPLAGLQLTGATRDGVVPVRIFGRNDDEAAWQPLGAAVLRQDGKPATADLGGASFRRLRIEADARTAGFSEAPRLELLFAPAELLVAFNNAPPYRLVVGMAGASGTALAVEELVPSGGPRPSTLPRAAVGAGAVQAVSLAPAEDPALSRRKLALWAALLAGVAVLGFAALSLARGQKQI